MRIGRVGKIVTRRKARRMSVTRGRAPERKIRIHHATVQPSKRSINLLFIPNLGGFYSDSLNELSGNPREESDSLIPGKPNSVGVLREPA
jgi:hypothetical protein